jgi:hypothetical protein
MSEVLWITTWEDRGGAAWHSSTQARRARSRGAVLTTTRGVRSRISPCGNSPPSTRHISFLHLPLVSVFTVHSGTLIHSALALNLSKSIKSYVGIMILGSAHNSQYTLLLKWLYALQWRTLIPSDQLVNFTLQCRLSWCRLHRPRFFAFVYNLWDGEVQRQVPL